MMRNQLVILLLSVFVTCYGQKACSSRRQEDMDHKMAKVLAIGENGRPYPETKKQLKGFCE